MSKPHDPTLAREILLAANFEPLEEYPGSAVKPWKAKCKICGEIVSPNLNNVKRGRRCKYCGLKRMGLTRRLDEDECIELMRSKNLEPMSEYPGAFKPWKCKCLLCGTIVSPLLNNVKKDGRGGCNRCGKSKSVESRRKPEHWVRQELVYAGALPLVEYPGLYTAPWASECLRCHREIYPRPQSVVLYKRDPCKYCSRTLIHEDDARALLLESGAEPIESFPGAGKPWRCKCLRCGKAISPRYDTVRRGSNPCKYCVWQVQAKYLKPPKSQPFSNEVAVARMRENGIEPIGKYPGGNSKPWKGNCLRCGTQVETSLSYATSNKFGCKKCGYESVSRARTMPETQAIAFMLQAHAKPMETYVSGATPWKCECLKCGAEIAPRLYLIRSGISAHPACPKNPVHGFKRDDPAVLYLITHPLLIAHKIGIAGVGSIRLDYHRSKGWEIYKVKRLTSGAIAYAIEQSILDWFRKENGWEPVVYGLSGWTETVSADVVSLPTIWRKVGVLERSLISESENFS